MTAHPNRELTKKEFTELFVLVEEAKISNASLHKTLESYSIGKKELKAYLKKRYILLEAIEGKLMDQYVSLYGQED